MSPSELMGEKQCPKCGEVVDEAKAFCPGCGEAFVEEKKRESVSEFDLSEHTVRLGDTMYNQMLSDMGLSISKQANSEEVRKETVRPITHEVKPLVPPPPPVPGRPSRNRWLIIGAIVIAIGFAILAVIVIVIAAILYFRQV